jgi:hypothetical protein
MSHEPHVEETRYERKYLAINTHVKRNFGRRILKCDIKKWVSRKIPGRNVISYGIGIFFYDIRGKMKEERSGCAQISYQPCRR